MNSLTRIMDPIGVIALFAGLSEASAATVLPYLDDQNRQIYIWFLIAFPSSLVLMFFLTLNFNPTALYPPSSACGTDHEPRTAGCQMTAMPGDTDVSDTYTGGALKEPQTKTCTKQQNL